ncbi:ankyrin repeat domain-containing protein 50-like [Mytilus californianus]|uniref:ankyrin repeat domain-containing protein 50-like n=1 Tax=Mytilus californianus TaxID=6549 RepID=UPI0022469285|nr:ankyrin repeat domain-containing protein 50-like [Mytilus californianus]
MYMISGCVPSLYIAAIQGYSDIVSCLVQNGADVDITGYSNMTPLFQASYGGFIEIVKILVESGADVNLCDNHNESPLCVASKEGHSDVVSYLIKNGGDVNICDEHGTSPLLASVENGHVNVLKTLLNNNAEVNNQLSGERLPFMITLMKGRVEIANFLLQNGADYKMKNEGGVTTMQIALWKNYSEILLQIVSLENRRKPFIGNFQLFQLLVDLFDFEVFQDTSCSINRNHNLPLLSFISKDTDEDGIKHLVKLGLGSKLDNKKKHLLLEYAITKSGVNKRVEKVKSLFDLCKSSNVRDYNSVSLLECTRKLFEQNKTLLKESKYRWENYPNEVFRECLKAVSLLDKAGNKTVSKRDVEEYWFIMFFLKQRIRRFSV